MSLLFTLIRRRGEKSIIFREVQCESVRESVKLDRGYSLWEREGESEADT